MCHFYQKSRGFVMLKHIYFRFKPPSITISISVAGVISVVITAVIVFYAHLKYPFGRIDMSHVLPRLYVA